jgi:hypothetical protein
VFVVAHQLSISDVDCRQSAERSSERRERCKY